MISRKTLIALLFASNAIGTLQPAFGIEGLRDAQIRVEEAKKYSDMNPSDYADALFNLAQLYYRNGRVSEAEKVFNDTLNLRRTSILNTAPAKTAEFLLSWARCIAAETKGEGAVTREEKQKINELAFGVLEEIDKTNNFSERSKVYLAARELFAFTKSEDGLSKTKETLLSMCQACESDKQAKYSEIVCAAVTFNIFAREALYCWIPTEIPANLIPKTEANGDFSEAKFNESEAFRLRATALLDRLGSNDEHRIRAHKELICFYLSFHKEGSAQKQREILNDLMRTTYPYPPPQTRRGCGSLASGRFCGMG
jgi:tetratricopeptide (TPR) repeat protein